MDSAVSNMQVMYSSSYLSPYMTIALSSPIMVCWGTVVSKTRQNVQYLPQLKIYIETRSAR